MMIAGEEDQNTGAAPKKNTVVAFNFDIPTIIRLWRKWRSRNEKDQREDAEDDQEQ